MIEKSQRRWLLVAALGAGLAVVLSAFGAHGLRGWLESQSELPAEQVARRLEVFSLGAQYQLIHCVAILAVAAVAALRAHLACGLWLLGMLVFSGCLYVYAITGDRAWAMPVPIGGSALILGWCALALAVWRTDVGISRP